ncbi:retroviral-like aspartic protease family protein [Lutibacter sp. A80]|uniref:retropepsin-like aspartic protease n=1 Tax=Lutibacter sp. A80 TaxID=2918453 RepID=UPI001F0602B6|nr:retropepsin-like aspartic protease [Lutibacter sp. A80]UMB59857.1 retroviral-like aspartic protease family protein [Lutibacter sp. A80]
MKLKKILLRKGFVKIKLKKINTNHFEVKAKLNGVKGRFILDTGASNSCLDITLAAHFKLKVEDSETLAAGAGATGMETKIAPNNTIKFKDWKYCDFNLVLLDLTHVNTALTEHNAKAVDGIIGADILEKGEAIIDYKKKCVYLKKFVFKF